MNLLGRGLFWLSWPLLLIYFRLGRPRAYVLGVCDGQVLLLKPWYGSGQWHLPGGGCHRLETPAQAAARELSEETAVVVPIDKLKLISKGKWQNYSLGFSYYIFLTRLSTKPQLQPRRLEIAATAWRPLSDLSSHNLAPEIIAAVRLADLV